jgi:endoglucanase
MRRSRWRRFGAGLAVGVTAVVTVGMATPAAADGGHSAPGGFPSGTRLYVPPDSHARDQAIAYAREGRWRDAALMFMTAIQPQATWFTSGTPDQVRTAVRQVVDRAARQHAVPVLVAYYVPFRDCSQFSAGGAPGEQAYRDWIDAFAEGIGNRRAVVILEPDGLSLLTSEPWCTLGPDEELVPERFREINYAIDTLKAHRNTRVYVDSGHSAWQPLNDYDAGFGEPRQQLGMVNRLLAGGIERADGFALNVSNYRFTAELVQYGTRLSKCLYLRTRQGATSCPDDATLDALPVNTRRMPHFVLDTSRNGRGHYTPGPDETDWCNPPGRGMGARPTVRTGVPLVDAYLWIKVPGESDGECQGGPAAGQWWPEKALELARNAEPALLPR